MKIVWFSWKDINHPAAGGAENVSWQIMKRLVNDGHQVKLVTASYPNAANRVTLDGIEIIRNGGRLGVYYKAFRLFRKELRDWPDLVIDEMNTLPFGVGFYSRKPRVLLAYQLARRVWFYQMVFPLSLIGYFLEPVYLFALSRRYHAVLTESNSTKNDMARYGFSRKYTRVFRVSIELAPLPKLAPQNDMNTIIILGAMRPMKRTLSGVKAFEIARDNNPELKLTIAGDNSGPYGDKVMNYIKSSRHQEAITVLGRVDAAKRVSLMREAALILVTSSKEGWGLIVTEANSQGTPAVAYNCDGVRDSIKDQKTGLLVGSGDEQALASSINDLLIDRQRYDLMREAAWQDSQQYTLDNSYSDFTNGAGIK